MNQKKESKINWSKALLIFIAAYILSKILLYTLHLYSPVYGEMLSNEWIAPVFVPILAVILGRIYNKIQVKKQTKLPPKANL